MEYHNGSGGEYVPKRRRFEFTISNATNADDSAIILDADNTTNSTVLQPSGGAHRRLSQQYIEWQLTRGLKETEQPNHILLFTVFNPSYEMTCEVLHTICTPISKVLRIVLLRKNGVQAMIEFESVDAATSVKEDLHGCDIYSGCCTLKVEYARPTRLNVYKNDDNTWNFIAGMINKSRAQKWVDSGRPDFLEVKETWSHLNEPRDATPWPNRVALLTIIPCPPHTNNITTNNNAPLQASTHLMTLRSAGELMSESPSPPPTNTPTDINIFF